MSKRTGPRQLPLDLRTWGGRRDGAGRKPRGATAGVAHVPRPEVSGRHPFHLTVRALPHVWSLRSPRQLELVRRALRGSMSARTGFRVVHFSVQTNHLHLLVEADDAVALRAGARSLVIRLAKGLNRLMRGRGPVFSDRYHLRPLTTPTETRRALAYVLGNFASHARRSGEPVPAGWLDPCSSAAAFDGWAIEQPATARAARRTRPAARPRRSRRRRGPGSCAVVGRGRAARSRWRARRGALLPSGRCGNRRRRTRSRRERSGARSGPLRGLGTLNRGARSAGPGGRGAHHLAADLLRADLLRGPRRRRLRGAAGARSARRAPHRCRRADRGVTGPSRPARWLSAAAAPSGPTRRRDPAAGRPSPPPARAAA
ncbi:hypothetical protein AMPC_14000 [Anaeromyxobacter paludicola]|uniref:Transposase IS200-like domain-containing protein n=1 Tax=Anaeromyxobacter paludicola TaxID=2918171 RepID=A0ABM7X8W4_9BACT|nr:hypothetical protein AMPC_14000 [Anaeromyxobacter paludicola]